MPVPRGQTECDVCVVRWTEAALSGPHWQSVQGERSSDVVASLPVSTIQGEGPLYLDDSDKEVACIGEDNGIATAVDRHPPLFDPEHQRDHLPLGMQPEVAASANAG
jgi:hypothetical protein